MADAPLLHDWIKGHNAPTHTQILPELLMDESFIVDYWDYPKTLKNLFP